MKILITGASGQLGQAIVRHLCEVHDITVAGRDPTKLRRLFPDLPAFSLDDPDTACRGMSAVIHLAAANNDQAVGPELFHKVNCEQTLELARAARSAKVERFIFFSSDHAAAQNANNHYGKSKREAEKRLAELDALKISILRLAPVISDRPRGRLVVVKYLPGFLRRAALDLFSALRPTVSLSTVIESVDRALSGTLDGIREITDRQEANRVYQTSKRILDLVGAVILLIFGGMVMALVAMILLMTQGRPIFFKSKRLGFEQRPFTLYKFRTMKQGTPVVGSHEVPDEAITKLGALLRRTKIDELPQAFNLIKGELSLVGPRPGLPSQTELCDERERRGVFRCLPGLTGLSQIQRIDMRTPEQLAAKDEEYLISRSLPLDLMIMVKTFVMLLPFRHR